VVGKNNLRRRPQDAYAGGELGPAAAVACGVFYIELGQSLFFAESYGPRVVDDGGLKELNEFFRGEAGGPSHFQSHEGNVLVVVEEPGMGEVQAVRKAEEELDQVEVKRE
jgi:hypothetical protein